MWCLPTFKFKVLYRIRYFLKTFFDIAGAAFKFLLRLRPKKADSGSATQCLHITWTAGCARMESGRLSWWMTCCPVIDDDSWSILRSGFQSIICWGKRGGGVCLYCRCQIWDVELQVTCSWVMRSVQEPNFRGNRMRIRYGSGSRLLAIAEKNLKCEKLGESAKIVCLVLLFVIFYYFPEQKFQRNHTE